MEAILEQLGLSTLLERFSDEKVDSHVVLARSGTALIRLGVATMGDRIRMKRLCREAVDCSGDWNGVDSVDSVDSVWFCYLSLTPFSSTRWMLSLSLIL